MRKIKTIYVVFKTHFDIGFTGLASEVINSYRGSMLKSVLKTCEATSMNEEGHRYVWTMPSWPLKKSLETQDIEMQRQALKFAREGRIAWHALPFTMHTDFAGTEEFIRGLGFSAELNRTFNKKNISAKMTDVPGHTRMLPSLLAKAGIKFLHLGCNACSNPPDVPRCFYWKGPDGNGVVTFYTKGGYGTELIPPDDWEYPIWLALMNTSDNQGPHSADVISHIISTVEEKSPGTRVVIGTLDDFAEAFLEYSSELPVIETDLADSWIHGVGTYPKEVSRIRALRKEAMNVEGVLTLKRLMEGHQTDNGTRKLFDTVYENLLLFDEHTWGLDTKITLKTLHDGKREYEKKLFSEEKKSPEYKRLEASWTEKSEYVNKAEDALSEVLKAFPEEKSDRITVYNLLTWERGGEVDVTGFALPGEAFVDSDGMSQPVYERDGRCLVLLKGVPAVGSKSFGLAYDKPNIRAYSKAHTEVSDKAYTEVSDKTYSRVHASTHSPEYTPVYSSVSGIENAVTETKRHPVATIDGSGGAVLENHRISVAIDSRTGCISSFYDKINRKEWAAPGEAFGGYTYDIHGKSRIIQYLKDYAYDLEDWYIADNGRPGYPWVSDRTYRAEKCHIEIDNCFKSGVATITWEMPEESVAEYGNAPEVKMTVTLEEDSDYVDITYHINGKEETPFVESGHFVFPLNASAPQYAIQKMGAAVNPATDIQYGANTSLYCCDRWVNVSDGDQSIAFFPKDTPLLSIGENRIYKYSKGYSPKMPVLFWNTFNNQWGTNFPQWVGGDFKYQFRVYPYSGDWNKGDMPKKSEEYATSLYPLRGTGEYHLLEQNIENANIICLKNADNGNGYIIRFQENRGGIGEIRIKLAGSLGITARCSLLEEDEKIYCDTPCEIVVKTAPFEIHTLRIIKKEK